jgi:hypothetical protein
MNWGRWIGPLTGLSRTGVMRQSPLPIALPSESSTILRADEGNRPPIRLDVDDGQCGKFGSD